MVKQTASARRAAKTAKAEGKKAKAEAKQTAKAELEEIGKQIAARVTIMRDYDAAAEEKAGHDLRKAQDERDTINNVLLVQARAKCKEAGESFEKFRKQYCPDLSRSRLYTVLAIADGRKTVEQDRAEKRESVAKSRAKVSSTSAVGDTPRVPRVATPNGTTLDTSGFSPKALEQIVKVTGNDVDTEASAETRKAAASETEPCDAAATAPPDPAVIAEKHKASDPPKANDGAVAEPEAEPTVAAPEAEPTVEEAEAEVKRLKAQRAALKTRINANANMEDGTKIDPKASANAMAEFNAACSTCLPQMSENDLQAAIYGFAEVVEVPAKELMPDLRQLQHELKIAKAEVTALKRKLAGKLPPRESRADAWGRHSGEARSSIEALISMQQEFEEAKDGQPDSLQEGPYAQKCEEICAIDLESALSTLEEAEAAEVPLGFGRD
jgi:hypothetical protein